MTVRFLHPILVAALCGPASAAILYTDVNTGNTTGLANWTERTTFASDGTVQAYDVDQSTGITGIGFQGTFALRTGLSPAAGGDQTALGADEGNRDLWMGTVGDAITDSSGEIVVYADFLSGQGRAWYDGVGVQAIPEPSTAILGGLGFLALWRRRRA